MNTRLGYLLIVEDDLDILKLLDATLTFRGYRVITARNGKEALEIVQAKRPDIVIADIMMPKLDGFGLVHRLRIAPETRDIPVVFITATYVAPEDREFALNIGATRFLQKPVDLERFLAIIGELSTEQHPSSQQMLNELSFYDEYKKRLEAKLAQKSKQIARDEHMLEIGSQLDEEHELLRASLHQAMSERDELKLLLDQVKAQLEKCAKPE